MRADPITLVRCTRCGMGMVAANSDAAEPAVWCCDENPDRLERLQLVPAAALAERDVALRPFAAFADRLDGDFAPRGDELDGPIWEDDEVVDTGVTRDGPELLVEHFRRARALLAGEPLDEDPSRCPRCREPAEVVGHNSQGRPVVFCRKCIPPARPEDLLADR